MSEAVVGALIGVAGAIIAAVVSYYASIHAAQRQIEEARRQFGIGRTTSHVDAVLAILAKALNAKFVENTRRRLLAGDSDSLRDLEEECQAQIKDLYFVDKSLSETLHEIVERYFKDLGKYARQENGWGWDQINERRTHTRNAIDELVNREIAGVRNDRP